MKRRAFQIGLLGTFSGVAYARRRLPPAPLIDAVSAIKALQIQCGPMTAGYQIAPAGMLNWYFVNLGLVSLVPHLNAVDLDFYIRRYLDLYLSRLEANASIQDVVFNDSSMQSFTLLPSDSDNSYAATLITLAARYLQASSNWSWWDANQDKLKTMVRANIVSQIKVNGLCRVFQLPRTSSLSEYGFTMNNCEDYRGLRDLASLLSQRGQSSEAEYFLQQAHRIGQAIESVLWDASSRGYRVSDQDRLASPRSFYPGCCCQVFPQAFGVIETSSHDGAAYAYLNAHAPNWTSEVYDPFPWCILGYVAAKRGDAIRAQLQLAATQSLYLAHPERVTINELGFYWRTRGILQGQLT